MFVGVFAAAAFFSIKSLRSTVSSLGFNTGYIEELYKQYLDDPDSVSESWREFFKDYHPDASFVPATQTSGDGEATVTDRVARRRYTSVLVGWFSNGT